MGRGEAASTGKEEGWVLSLHREQCPPQDKLGRGAQSRPRAADSPHGQGEPLGNPQSPVPGWTRKRPGGVRHLPRHGR